MQLKKGLKTTELWIGVIGAIVVALQQTFFPESPFPLEAFGTVGVWIGMRMCEKVFIKPGERPWATSEFWISMGFPVLKVFWPEIPPQFETFIYTYLIGRPAIKVGAALKNGN